ncbi:serine hydrolase domain-containing protein [Flavobacteriaceae sp. LMIT009]
MTILKKIALLSILSVCFFSCKKEPQTDNSGAIYSKFIDDMKAENIATGNILVYKKGEVIFKSADGLRSINPIDSLDINDQFRLASVSKQFTGMAIMKLKEAGKIEYDQKVNTILTDFPYDNITVRQLLHHVSGLADYMGIIEANWTPTDSTKIDILGNDEILNVFYSVKPELNFQPGERWEYSNTGYIVLASIVEKISGKHFRDFIKEQITDPLGMSNTEVYKYQIEVDPNMPDRVFGYSLALNQKDLVLNDYNILNDARGDGGVYSTLEDLYKWNMALANYTIIPKDYLDEAWTSGKLNNGEKTNYGFGWGLEDDESKPQSVSHSGGWVGFGTFLYNEVETKSGFVVLTNNSFENFGGILDGISNIWNGEPYDIPNPSLRRSIASVILEDGIDNGITLYHELKVDTTRYKFSEQEINSLGYQFLGENYVDEALGIFKLNIQEYPESANTYDSYGDALLVKGDSLKALENFQKCFEMDGTMIISRDKAKKLKVSLEKTK